MKKITLLSLIFVLLMVFSSSAYAEPVNQKITTLIPSESSSILSKVELIEDVNGIVSVRIEGTATAGDHRGYHIVVNQETKTYSATLTELEPSQQTENQLSSQLLGATYYTAHVRAHTYDPINIDCNWTDLGFTWKDDGNGNGYSSITHAGRSLNTWDGNPTSAGTNWYLFSSRYYNSTPSGNTESAEAVHVNYNFLGGIFGSTYATHNISIYPQPEGNGRYNWYTTFTPSGDGAAKYLLHLYTEVY
ncbi:hypothetical protein FHR92_002992 [Fontibacillus solani]|uniref:Uncharacterized protein n=1 Tax=Fontibacillus solani TaxID=1572857 RepID=A0A7W3SUN1_9BACL|nr:hypothetical protein [Fontibacillus solani]MBA9086514.1 hypothetical protein [Fontibacillus solani]